MIPLFLLLICGWFFPELRLWLAIAALTMAVGLAMTFGYVYPINATLIFKAGGDRSDDEIRSLTRRWIAADRLRFAIMTIGFLALLYAFRIFA